MSDTVPNAASQTVKSAGDFLALVRDSGLVALEKWAALEAAVADWKAAAGPIPEACKRALIDGDLLTEWQINKLLGGQSKGFFLGDCMLLKPLGQGGMGSVYLAHHPELKKVALKILPRTTAQSNGASLERFQQENWAASQLHHKNIARAWFDFGDATEDSRYHYFMMEYIEGTDLDKQVRKHGPLSPRDAARFIREAALGLHHAHEEGIVHRDIKPANLMIDKKGDLKILDLGLVQMDADDEPTKTLAQEEKRKSLGTPDYMAPEQARGRPADRRSDIYSLGCTLYFLLSGRPPFDAVQGTSGGAGTRIARMQAHLDKHPPNLLETRPDLPPELVEMMLRMMEKRPDARVQSAQEVAAWFDAWLAGRRAPLPASAARPTSSAAQVLRDPAVNRAGGVRPGNAVGGSGVVPAPQRPHSGGSHAPRQTDTPPPSSSARSTGRMPAASSARSSASSSIGTTAGHGSAGRSSLTPAVQPKGHAGGTAASARPNARQGPAAAKPAVPQPAAGLPTALWLAVALAVVAALTLVGWLLFRR